MTRVATRVATLERARGIGKTAGEPMVIVVVDPTTDADPATREQDYARAMDFARPILDGLGCISIVTVKGDHCRRDAPAGEPPHQQIWSGDLHQDWPSI